nr:hypothetical protein CFP56_11489 [Quercus suber]
MSLADPVHMLREALDCTCQSRQSIFYALTHPFDMGTSYNDHHYVLATIVTVVHSASFAEDACARVTTTTAILCLAVSCLPPVNVAALPKALNFYKCDTAAIQSHGSWLDTRHVLRVRYRTGRSRQRW